MQSFPEEFFNQRTENSNATEDEWVIDLRDEVILSSLHVVLSLCEKTQSCAKTNFCKVASKPF